jgi:hypothetical protein
MKNKETLEEVAETISQKIRFQIDIISDDFENGVQTSMKVFYKFLEDLLYYAEKEEALKQEQDKKLYSEEDMKKAFHVGFNVGYNDEESPSYLTFEEWIKEYKKK